ncbi:hypothetical protein [Tsukamurella tyrosinosolvens]|uniref:hypothetical protein n=2 Tax=Tsukamurella tyrosinosolvens TaxID=57704 RepID=UPI001CE146C9|nr:hypothetical protein [Tsukamurella tyrosinosolvens]
MAFDSHVNLLFGVVQSVAGSGEVIALRPGHDARFVANMPVTLHNPQLEISHDNAEIGYVTAVDGDTLTILRAQEGSSLQDVGPGWRVSAMPTAKTFTDIEGALDQKVDDDDLASVAKTGSYADLSDRPTIPTVPVQSVNGRTGDVTGLAEADAVAAGLATKATPADIANAINSLVDAAPGTLDTLNELAAALGDDPNFAATVASQIASKLDKSASANILYANNGVGNPTVLTYSQALPDGSIAQRSSGGTLAVGTPTSAAHATRKDYVDNADALKVNKAGDTMTGMLQNTREAGLSFSHTRGGAMRSWGTGSDGQFTVWNDNSGAAIFRALNDGLTLGSASTPHVRYGTGHPNSVVTAPVGSIYIDTNVTNGASSWIKKSGAGNTGWQILEGDTGWRNIGATLENGWTCTSLQLRRVNNVVSIKLDGLNASAKTADAAYTVPTGFQYGTGSNPRALLHTAATPAVPYRIYLDTKINVSGATTGMPLLYGQTDVTTTQAWPVALPGTAV